MPISQGRRKRLGGLGANPERNQFHVGFNKTQPPGNDHGLFARGLVQTLVILFLELDGYIVQGNQSECSDGNQRTQYEQPKAWAKMARARLRSRLRPARTTLYRS